MVKGTDEAGDRQLEHQKQRKFQRLLIKVGLVYALLSVALYFMFSSMLEQHAYRDMSRDEVQHISEMVFESMYTAMLNGSGSQGIEEAARRMNETGPGMVISIIRGERVAEKFGDHKVDAIRRQNDLAIFEVFRTGNAQFTHKEQRIRYLYPAIFREQCKACHETSQPGEVAAVVEIIYPIKNLKVSTNYVNRLMLSYFAFSFVLLIAFLAWRYKTD